MELKLTIDLVPSTSWYNNVRSAVSPTEWDRIRKRVYAEHHHRCGICGAQGRLEAHEIWRYDDASSTQILDGLIALCNPCHRIKHIGHSQLLASQGKLDMNRLITHFCDVNACDAATFQTHKTHAFQEWRERSRKPWNLNLEFLDSLDK